WGRLRGERLVLQPPDRAAAPVGDGLRELTETDGLFTAWAKSYGCTAAVVRPDRYVFGLARDAAELNCLVADVHRHVFGSNTHVGVVGEQANGQGPSMSRPHYGPFVPSPAQSKIAGATPREHAQTRLKSPRAHDLFGAWEKSAAEPFRGITTHGHTQPGL